MATITTKYSVGDVVYLASTATERKQHPCPDCEGSRKWTAISKAGKQYDIPCPRCSTSYRSKDELSLDYTASVPITRKLTIGSIKTDSHAGSWGNDEPVSYMCQETGVGSGNVWRESLLFETEDEALRAATVMAAHSNETTPWIVTLYNKSLEISDYQIENAAMKDAQDYKHRASSLLYNLNDLFGAINDAGDKDAVLEAVDEYKRFYWEGDLSKLTQGIEARSDETQSGSAVGESPVAESDAP